MPAGLGGAGYVVVAFEAVMGTYIQPNAAGVKFVPITEESLQYQEDKYYSPQIRQQTIESDVKQSFYSVAGDITMEADAAFLPYFLYASRHTPTKTGAADPWTYKYVPSQAGSASTAAGPTTAKTLSITVVRNGVGFGYAGCVLGGYSFSVEDGILMFTANILGLSEETPASLGTPAWLSPELFGADTSSVYVAASAVAPTFGAASTDFNGFEFSTSYNAEAQNRIRSDRKASYIAYGATEATYDTELDFIDKVEYDNFKAATTRAVKLESLRGGATFALATEGVQVQINRSAYDTYEVGLGGMGDLIMAGVTGRALGIAGGDPYAIQVKGNVDIL